MMVLNPKVEIYLIDDGGKILAFFADPPGELHTDRVDTGPIERYLRGPGRLTLGADPRDPGRTRPFSAAPVRIAGGSGFVYIVLGGQQFASVSAMVRNSYIARTGLAAILLALGYAGGICLLVSSGIARRVTDAVACVGRLALTNYIGQSVIATAIFYWWGLGLFGQVSRAGQLGLVLAICLAQVVISVIWLRWFRFGPLEWLWRSLTYGRRQPMSRQHNG